MDGEEGGWEGGVEVVEQQLLGRTVAVSYPRRHGERKKREKKKKVAVAPEVVGGGRWFELKIGIAIFSRLSEPSDAGPPGLSGRELGPSVPTSTYRG